MPFCGPIVRDSFPKSKTSEEANTFAASSDTSASPLISFLASDSICKYLKSANQSFKLHGLDTSNWIRYYCSSSTTTLVPFATTPIKLPWKVM